MSFAGKVWRLLVGIKDALSLAFLLLFFWALFAVLNARPSAASVRDGALLLQLDGTIVEEPSAIDPLAALLSSAVPTREYAARDIVHAVDEAAEDERIKALALDLSTFLGGGLVHMEAIGDAIDRFRRTGKPVLTYAVAYTDDSLLLAARSSEVWVDPLGGAAIAGPGGQNIYYADLLQRLRVNTHIYRVGTYKSAVEPYILNEMSPEARENAEALNASLWQEWQASVKQARPQVNIALATQQIETWLERSDGDLAKAALQAGLVDKIGDRVAWGEHVASIAGEDAWDDSPGAFAATDLDTWLAEVGPAGGTHSLAGSSKPIGVITVAGEISDGRAGPGQAGAERIVRLLDEALNDDLAALVVRVNSPGGTVTGSEAIRRAILRHKARGVPVAVSMGNVAASGGYWIATSGDQIFAEPETITGSIGIWGVVPTFENTLAQYGVTSDGVRTTPLSGQPDLFGGFTPETDVILQQTVENGYRRFLTLVAQSRDMTPERVDQLGQGRVWDGGSARQLGLVDQFGDLDAALAWAASEAGLNEGGWHPQYLGQPAGTFDSLLLSLLTADSTEAPQAHDMFGYFAGRQAALSDRLLADLDRLMGLRGMQALCLECEATRSPASQRPPASSPASSVASIIARLLLD